MTWGAHSVTEGKSHLRFFCYACAGTAFILTQAPRNADAHGYANSFLPHSGDPLLGLAAPGGIVQIAGQSLHWAVGETLTLGSGQASNLAIAANLRLHTGQAIGWLVEADDGAPEDTALCLVSGEGELDVQAQNDEIKLQNSNDSTLAYVSLQLPS